MITEKQFDLSSLEAEILRFTAAGYTTAEIADRTKRTTANIYYYLSKLYCRFGVSNKKELRIYLSRQIQPKDKYESSLIDTDLASYQYKLKLFYKQKRLRIINAISNLKYQYSESKISKHKCLQELDNIIAVILQELT